MKIYFGLPFLFIFSMACSAAPQSVDLSVPTLRLKNGKEIQNAVIKTYDNSTGRVVVTADRSVVSLQLELLPDELAVQVSAMVPVARRSEKPNTAKSAAVDRAERTKRNSLPASPAQKIEPAVPDAAVATVDEIAASQISEIKRLASNRAYRYYRYEQAPGSGAVAITGGGIQLEQPEPVPGWTGRYRVTGEIQLAFYDSSGRSFNHSTGRFEVLTETNEKGITKVVDFSPR